MELFNSASATLFKTLCPDFLCFPDSGTALRWFSTAHFYVPSALLNGCGLFPFVTSEFSEPANRFMILVTLLPAYI
jgi:hypothetical protein